MPADVEYVLPPRQNQNENAAATPGRAAVSSIGSVQADTVAQKQGTELDQKLGEKQKENLARMQTRLTQYNATLGHPKDRLL